MAAPNQVTYALLEFLGMFLGLAGCILVKIDHRQPKPYMDEIFHVPQAKQYCQGDFSKWDPMITTLPGLYLSSVSVMQLVAWLSGIPIKVVCSTFWLRATNIGFATGNVILYYLLLHKLNSHYKNYNSMRSLMTAAALGMFPLLYFYTFLYYTDPGSIFFILCTYLLSLHKYHVLASLAGFVAVLFRQTNIVWVAFAAGLSFTKILMDHMQLAKKDVKQEQMQGLGGLQIIVQYLWRSLTSNRANLRILIQNTVSELWSYIVLGISFVVFVYVNGGIVVGAKGDHQACLHLPQLFYFISFTAAFAFPHVLSIQTIVSFLKDLWKRPFLFILLGSISAVMVWKFTFEHRYLLADNRHYPFYIWHKVFKRHNAVKYILIPGYLCAGWCLHYCLKHKNILWKSIFLFCIALQVVPQMLFEFRYFIVPYVIFRLNLPLASYPRLTAEMLLYVAVNVFTLYMYMEKPFVWAHDNSKQRFMW